MNDSSDPATLNLSMRVYSVSHSWWTVMLTTMTATGILLPLSYMFPFFFQHIQFRVEVIVAKSLPNVYTGLFIKVNEEDDAAARLASRRRCSKWHTIIYWVREREKKQRLATVLPEKKKLLSQSSVTMAPDKNPHTHNNAHHPCFLHVMSTIFFASSSFFPFMAIS